MHTPNPSGCGNKKPVQVQLQWGQSDENLSVPNGILWPHGYAGEFQKAIELTLTNFENTFAYLEDIIIVTKVSKDTHKELLHKVL